MISLEYKYITSVHLTKEGAVFKYNLNKADSMIDKNPTVSVD